MGIMLDSELQAEQDSGMNNREWMSGQMPSVTPHLPKLPTLEKLTRAPEVDMSVEALFECGLAVILDGLQAQAKARS